MLKNGSKKILIADNDEVILIAFEHTLETEGYDTAVALSAEEIFWMLSRANFDLVVLDDYLSDKDSFEVLARFQQAEIRTAVVVTHRIPSRDYCDFCRFLRCGWDVCVSPGPVDCLSVDRVGYWPLRLRNRQG
jgi:DNA-binding response OmpR family regulator